MLQDEIPILGQSIRLQYCVSSVTNKTPLSFLHSYKRFSRFTDLVDLLNWVNCVMFLPVFLAETGAYPQLPIQPFFLYYFQTNTAI